MCIFSPLKFILPQKTITKPEPSLVMHIQFDICEDTLVSQMFSNQMDKATPILTTMLAGMYGSSLTYYNWQMLAAFSNTNGVG